MLRFAIKMLFGDSAKFYGILLGLGFASLLIAQQASIFVGLMSRTFAFIGEVGHVDLWVFDPTQSYVDEPKPLRTTALERVRGVTGVAWAAPLYKGLLVATLPDGSARAPYGESAHGQLLYLCAGGPGGSPGSDPSGAAMAVANNVDCARCWTDDSADLATEWSTTLIESPAPPIRARSSLCQLRKPQCS